MKVIPALITFHTLVCTQSSPYPVRLGWINILIIERILPWMGDAEYSRASRITERRKLSVRVLADPHRW